MKVIVCGSRSFSASEFVWTRLDALHADMGFTLVVTGGARGADNLADFWAVGKGIPTVEMPAKWDLYGRAAGPIRNKEMLDTHRPGLVVAFKDKPVSRGTDHMLNIATRAGVGTIVYNLPS